MKSVDANVALRWLTRDDPHQAALADAVMRGPVFLCLTVLIEVAWVLQRTYRFDRAMLNRAIGTLIDLENVTVDVEAGVRWALERQAAGADLPDMLHLIASHGAAAFATFERHLARDAGPTTPLRVECVA